METLRFAGQVVLSASVVVLGSCSWFGGGESRGVGTDTLAPGEETTSTADHQSDDAARNRAGESDGVEIEDLVSGEGAAVTLESSVVMRLSATLADGTVVYRVEESPGPWPVDGLVEGLAEGLLGMSAGGKRRITVSPEMGYGERDILDDSTGEVLIPAGSTLIFEVELIEVQGGGEAQDQNESSTPEEGDGESS